MLLEWTHTYFTLLVSSLERSPHLLYHVTSEQKDGGCLSREVESLAAGDGEGGRGALLVLLPPGRHLSALGELHLDEESPCALLMVLGGQPADR